MGQLHFIKCTFARNCRLQYSDSEEIVDGLKQRFRSVCHVSTISFFIFSG